MSLENIALLKNSIPQENRACDDTFFPSMLVKGVSSFLQGDLADARYFLMAISSFCDIKKSIEWECYEWSSFLLLYINGVSPYEKDARFFIKKYQKRLVHHFYLRKEFYVDFYSKKSIPEIRKEIKGSLRRRWDKTFLNRCLVAIEDANKEGDVNSEWVEMVSCFIEAIYLMYVVGNVNMDEVKIIEKKAKNILEVNSKNKLAPYEVFYF